MTTNDHFQDVFSFESDIISPAPKEESDESPKDRKKALMLFLKRFLSNKSYVIAAVIVLLAVFASIIFGLLSKGKMTTSDQMHTDEQQDASDSAEQSDTPSSSPEIVPPTGTSPKPKASASPTPQPTPSPSSSPYVPDPPKMNISYPYENQYVEFTSTNQTLCVVDVPAGGNTQGLVRKQSINNSGWTAYTTPNTLCFTPKEGNNIFSLQYKNGNGDESQVYTRSFSFHLVTEIGFSISGTIYRDENCNGSRDANEDLIKPSATVRFSTLNPYTIYATTSSNSGQFGYNGAIKENKSLTLEVGMTSPPGYKSNPHFTNPQHTFSKNSTHADFQIPQVPNEFVGACFPNDT